MAFLARKDSGACEKRAPRTQFQFLSRKIVSIVSHSIMYVLCFHNSCQYDDSEKCKQAFLPNFSTRCFTWKEIYNRANWHDKLLTRLSSLYIFYADEILTLFCIPLNKEFLVLKWNQWKWIQSRALHGLLCEFAWVLFSMISTSGQKFSKLRPALNKSIERK